MRLSALYGELHGRQDGASGLSADQTESASGRAPRLH